jgi:hypothetical protein
MAVAVPVVLLTLMVVLLPTHQDNRNRISVGVKCGNDH